MQSLDREARTPRSPFAPLTAVALGVLAALVLLDAVSPSVFWVEKLYLLALAAGMAACARLVWSGAPRSSLWTAAALGADVAVAASADALTVGGVAVALAVALGAALAERGRAPLPRAWWWAAGLVAWGGFCAWLVSGFPPSVDLPAHGAQMQTMVEILRGAADVREVYRLRFPLGYGLPYWLYLPLAWMTNGGVAMRAALWTAMVAYPVSVGVLLRAAERPATAAVLSLPLVFNVSYWYGLVSGLYAQPLALLALASYLMALRDGRRRWVVAANVAGLACLLAHLVSFAVLAFIIGFAALATRPRARAMGLAASSMGLPVMASLPKVWSMASRAMEPATAWPENEYGAVAHFNWFFRNNRVEGLLSTAGPLAITAAFIGLAWWRRRTGVERAARPVAMFAGMCALYVATPKTLSGIYLIAMRLPVFAGVLALLLAPWDAAPRWLKGAMLAVVAVFLAQTGSWHERFKREVDGLETLIAGPRPPHHGYVPLSGLKVLGSRHIYAEHLGQWWTAERGGVGHHFFADAEHHPVWFQDNADVPPKLDERPDRLGWFDELLVFGDGPLPDWLNGFEEVERAGAHWRKLRRRR